MEVTFATWSLWAPHCIETTDKEWITVIYGVVYSNYQGETGLLPYSQAGRIISGAKEVSWSGT